MGGVHGWIMGRFARVAVPEYYYAHCGLTGHLWVGRFFSAPMDDFHLWAAVRYVELNPVGAGLCSLAQEWKWSSAATHVSRGSDVLLSGGGPFVQGEVSDWGAWLHESLDDETVKRIRLSTQTGRPCGDKSFIEGFEEKLERLLTPQKPGPKPRREDLLTEDLFS
jgi:putative transposase